MCLNARSSLAGRAYGCTGCGWGGGGFPVDYLRSKPAGASSLKPWHGYEEIAAFFEKLLEEMPCRCGHWRLQLKGVSEGMGRGLARSI